MEVQSTQLFFAVIQVQSPHSRGTHCNPFFFQPKGKRVVLRASLCASLLNLLLETGAASVSCAETLRQEGFKGKIVMATKETCLPYDRPKLSKALSSKPEEIALRNSDFYSTHDIKVDCHKEVIVFVCSHFVKQGVIFLFLNKRIIKTNKHMWRKIPVLSCTLWNSVVLHRLFLWTPTRTLSRSRTGIPCTTANC